MCCFVFLYGRIIYVFNNTQGHSLSHSLQCPLSARSVVATRRSSVQAMEVVCSPCSAFPDSRIPEWDAFFVSNSRRRRGRDGRGSDRDRFGYLQKGDILHCLECLVIKAVDKPNHIAQNLFGSVHWI